MSRTLLLSLLIACSIIGVADSAYLAESAITDTELACDINGLSGCNAVAQSVYAQPFGIPLGVYGIGFYGLMLIILVALFWDPRPFMYKALFGLSVMGALASCCFVAIQVFLIQALCIYCLLSALLAFLLLAGSWFALSRFSPRLPVVVP